MRNVDVLLSVGLPLTRFGAEKQDFIDYLSKKKEVGFHFEKEKYAARIARVSVQKDSLNFKAVQTIFYEILSDC